MTDGVQVGRKAMAFVLCPSFHGATLLALLLNNHSDISALGDTSPSRAYDQTCACGAKVSTCPFWQTVAGNLDLERFAGLNSFLPSLPRPLANRTLEGGALHVTANATANRIAGHVAGSIADTLLPVIWRRDRSRAVSDYIDIWRAFYNLVREVHGTSIVIDGSKSSRKVELMLRELREEPTIKVIHLVRDPRGFVASTAHHENGTGLRSTSWLWSDLHERMEALGSLTPYLRVRYEDLALRPEQEMRSILEFLDLSPEPVVAAPRFSEKHHLMGNAMLFKFDGTVTSDERWRTALPREDQARVVKYAGRTAEAYGYTFS